MRVVPGLFSFRSAAVHLVAVLWTASFAQTVNQRLWIPNGQVRAMAKGGHDLYIGGDFTYVGPVTGSGVTVGVPGGIVLPASPVVNGEVFAAIPDGSNGWYIGGNFTQISGIARNNIAHVLANGTVDAWNPNANGAVRVFSLSSDRVFVGGDFTIIGGVARSHIAALSRSTGNALGWNPNSSGVVRALALSGPTIYVGGTFTSIGDSARNAIAAFDTSSRLALSYNPDVGGGSRTVNAIAIGPNGIYIGGDFSSVRGLPRSYIASLRGDGSPLPALAEPNGAVNALALAANALYVGGNFSAIGGQPRFGAGAVSPFVANALPWNPTTNRIDAASVGFVNALVLSGSAIFIGGDFRRAGGQARNYLAAVDTVGAGTLLPWNPVAGGIVNSLSIAGTIAFAGGKFTSVGGVLRNYLAAISDSLGTATSFNANIARLGQAGVRSLALSGATLYVGGDFDSVSGQFIRCLCAVNASTGALTEWRPLQTPLSYSGEGPYALATAGGRVYAGGSYSISGGTPQRFALVAFDSATGAMTPWNPNLALTDYVTALGVAPPSVYVGGFFSTIGDSLRSKIAALDIATAKATSWNPNSNGIVYSVLPAGPTVYIGGLFSTIRGQTRNSLAAVDATTGLPTPLNPFSTSHLINATALSGNNLYVGGSVGTDTSLCVSVNVATGVVASSWRPSLQGGGASGARGSGVAALTISDTGVYAGGLFSSVQNSPRSFLAGFGDASLSLPAFFVNRTAIDFGTARVGGSKTDSVLVRNTGGNDLIISSVASTNQRYTVTPQTANVPRGGSRVFRITFIPVAPGPQNALIEFSHNALGSPMALTVSGNGIAPEFSVVPTSLEFAAVIVNTSRRDSLGVRNRGNDTLRISSAQTGSTNFAVTPPLVTIPPDSVRKFFVTFTPDSALARRDTIFFTHDASGSPSRVPLSGTGVAPAFFVQPTVVDFGNVLVNTTIRDSSVVVTNRGTSTLNIINASTSSPRFRVDPPSASLAANANQRFVISFTPDATQLFGASIIFVHDASGSPTNVAVSGRGVAPLFAVNPTHVDFGNVVINTASLDSTIVVTNSGGAPLTISSVTSSDTQFAVTPRNAVIIHAGEARRFTLSFTPNSQGQKSSQVVFAHDAAGSPDTIVAAGTGVVSTFSLDSASLSFGSVRIGANRSKNIVVSNGGTNPILISSVRAGNPQFTVTPTRDSIPPGQSRTFVARFTPTVPATITSNVTFTHNAAGSPTGVPVSGTGLGALFVALRQSLQFGGVRVGTSKEDSTIIRNDGNDTLIISASVPNTRFAVQPNAARINSGASRAFTVTFSPAENGSVFDTLFLAHNAPGSPAYIPLAGTGATPSILVSPTFISFGETALGNGINRQASLINNGIVSLAIDSVRIHGTHASEFSITGSRGPFPSVAPGDTQQVFLRFTPQTVEENKSAILVVSGNMATTPDTVGLLGTGRSSLVRITLSGDSVVGGRVSIDAQGPQGFQVDRALLFSRVAGRRRYDSLDLAPRGGVYNGTFDTGSVTPRGIEYYVRFVGTQGSITNPESDPVNNPAVLRVHVPRLSSPQRFGEREYKMISIPLDVNDTTLAGQLVDDYGPYNPLRWRLFRWERGANLEFPQIKRSFKPGHSFWLVTQSGQPFDAGEAKSVFSGRPYEIRLDPGWNQIASPFAFPIAWDNVVNRNLVGQPFFFDGMEFVPRVPTLNPWEGYFVFNDSSQSVSLLVPPLEAGLTAAKQTASTCARGEYVLQLSATAGRYRDTYNFIGFMAHARNGDDTVDAREPPAVNENIQLSILEDGKKYVANFKQLNRDGHLWRLQASSPAPYQTVRVALLEQGSLPDGFRLYILDEDEFAAVAISNNVCMIHIPEAHRIRSFKVIIGTEEFARETSGGIPLQPVQYSLAQNYPNPFNPTTTIHYTLNKRSDVALEIFNLLGQKVKTLVNTEQTTGFHSSIWDGSTDAGTVAASGVFLYRLRAVPNGDPQAAEFRATRKLILLR